MDQGTEERRDNTDARAALRRLKSEVFDESAEQLALSLGRPVEEVEAWLGDGEQIDEDAEMKIHGLAEQRLGGE